MSDHLEELGAPAPPEAESATQRRTRIQADWRLSERLLYAICKTPPDPRPAPPGERGYWERNAYVPGERLDPLRKVLPEATAETFRGARVIDFGSGAGQLAFDLAPLAREVIGLEIRDEMMEQARAKAAALQLDNVRFLHSERDGVEQLQADLVVSTDAFEHFQDPAAILALCARALKPGGRFLISFGPPWLHPYGHHLTFMSGLPWFHLPFSERTLLSVRRLYRRDEARSFAQSSGGLGRLTVGGFLRHVRQSEFDLDVLRVHAIKGLRPLVWLPGVREFFTSVVACVLRRR